MVQLLPFIHSLSRAEQVMGIWKSRFQCLLDPLRLDHMLTTKIIYSTAILHNLFTTFAGQWNRTKSRQAPFLKNTFCWQVDQALTR